MSIWSCPATIMTVNGPDRSTGSPTSCPAVAQAFDPPAWPSSRLPRPPLHFLDIAVVDDELLARAIDQDGMVFDRTPLLPRR